MERLINARKIRLDEKLDGSANELYGSHILELSAAFARANHKEAADRKLAVKSLWYGAGRSSEPGFLSYSGMKWDPFHDAIVMESFQSKPSKLKFVPFIAAPNRHMDWTLDFGDHLVFDRGMTVYAPDDEEEGKCWLLP